MEAIIELVTQNGFTLAAAIGIFGIILNIILKKFITQEHVEKWGTAIKNIFKGFGVVCTVGLTKFKYISKLWNNTFEPYVILLLRMVILNALNGFIEGLESDNNSMKK